MQVQDIAFGKLLSKLMDRSGISQTDLAKRARSTQPAISAICNGHRQCGVGLATRFADALGLKDEERRVFLQDSRKPKWKGFDHELYGPEAVLFDVFNKALSSNGINATQMLSVTPLDQQMTRGKAIIIMKTGETIEFSLSIRRQVMETPEPIPPSEDSPVATKVNGRIYTEEGLQRSTTAEIEKEIGKKTPTQEAPPQVDSIQQTEDVRPPEVSVPNRNKRGLLNGKPLKDYTR